MCEMEGQLGLFAQDTWSGKTCREPFQAATQKDRTSRQSSKKSSKSASRAPVCMCLYPTEDGQNPGAITLKMVPGALLGEYTTHSFGESPSEENASRLSQILEDSAPQKYYLSAKACEGILRRAQRRGKELPPELKRALEEQSASLSEPENQGGAKDCSAVTSTPDPCRQKADRTSAAVDVYNQTIDGQTAASVTAAVGGGQTPAARR